MYNWINIYEKNDLSYISRTGKLCKRASKVYDKLSDELVDTFGVSEDYMKILRLKIKVEMLWGTIIETKDRSKKVFIDMYEIEIEELKAKNKQSDLFDMIIAIEENIGVKMNYKTLTVYEFHKYAKRLSNKIKHAK